MVLCHILLVCLIQIHASNLLWAFISLLAFPNPAYCIAYRKNVWDSTRASCACSLDDIRRSTNAVWLSSKTCEFKHGNFCTQNCAAVVLIRVGNPILCHSWKFKGTALFYRNDQHLFTTERARPNVSSSSCEDAIWPISADPHGCYLS